MANDKTINDDNSKQNNYATVTDPNNSTDRYLSQKTQSSPQDPQQDLFIVYQEIILQLGYSLDNVEKVGGVTGQGDVYKINEKLAIKFLKCKGNKQQEQQHRFLQEMMILYHLKKTCPDLAIPHIYEYKIHHGIMYYVMDYIQGKPLKNCNDLTLEQKITIIHSLTKVLAKIHAENIIHRDLKPSNIIIEEKTNRPYLIDFGVAKDIRDFHPNSKGVTREGYFVGTFVYMSPEQLDSKNITIASDVYSLGVIFYELLTGKHPTGNPNLEEDDWLKKFIGSLLTKNICKPHKIDKTVPAKISKLCMKMLEKNALHRPSCSELSIAFQYQHKVKTKILVALFTVFVISTVWFTVPQKSLIGNLQTKQKEYRIGNMLEFSLDIKKTSHLRIFIVENNIVYLFFPNRYSANNLLTPGAYTFGNTHNEKDQLGWELEHSGDYHIIAIAQETAFDDSSDVAKKLKEKQVIQIAKITNIQQALRIIMPYETSVVYKFKCE